MRRSIEVMLLCALLALCCIGSAFAEESANLLHNPGFEQAQDGWPLYWEQDRWRYEEGVTEMGAVEGGHESGYCAMIENNETNDARFIQDVPVNPGSYYRVAGWVKAQGCDPDFEGASLSIIGSYGVFPDVHETYGEWVFLEYYVETALLHETLTIGPRLGDYNSDTTGKAWFDDISFTEVDALPVGAPFFQLHDYSDQGYMAGDQGPEPESDQMPARADASPLVGSLLLVVLCFGLWILRAKGIPLSKAWMWGVLLLAALVRIYLMITQLGYDSDIKCFFSWAQRMVSVGPGAFYTDSEFCDYPPGYMYLLWITGMLMKLFGVNTVGETGRFMVKLVPMVLEMGTIYMIWHLAKKHLSQTAAVLLAAFYALNPAILVDGAMWGQVDAVLAFGLLLTVIFATEGKWRWALPAFFITVLMKPQALLAAPIGLIAVIMDGMRRKNRQFLWDVLTGLVASLLAAAIVLLPFLWGKAQPLQWVLDRYSASMFSAHYQVATLNVANLYALLGWNWTPLDEMAGMVTIGTLGNALMIGSVVAVMALFVWRGKRERVAYFCALILIALYLLAPKMHERYLFPALVLLLAAYIQTPDKRILALFSGFSLTFYINCSLVLRNTHLPVGFHWGVALLAVVNLCLLGLAVWVAVDKKVRPLKPVDAEKPRSIERLDALRGKTPGMPRMRKWDWVLMLGLTGVYAVIAYAGLGSNVAPQTTFSTTGATEVVTADLGSFKEFNILFYPGIVHRDHVVTFEFSADGESWKDASPASVKPGGCFQWQYVTQATYDQNNNPTSWMKEPLILGARFVQIVFDGPGVDMMEVVFRDMEGNLLPVLTTNHFGAYEDSGEDPAALFDEPKTAPQDPSYYNSMYFDEIYHGRTGYEHAQSMQTYEWTHPPLGKVLIMLGIKIFGMTAFGWRCMGALMGVLMVPMMYLLGLLLFKKTKLAFLTAFVMAFDMMHLTQTRIATIDSYAVLCIIIMYFFMFRYLQMSFFRDGWRTLIPLGLSGLFMGIGCASKWICFYAGVGLAVLFFWSMAQRFMEWRKALKARDVDMDAAGCADKYPRYLIGTLLSCLLFFIIIPAAIYYLSYIPHYAWEGGLTLEKFIKTQEDIFRYHSTLTAAHDFMSNWYEWPLILKPMYYYNGKPYVGEGNISTIMAMGNPAVWWIGLIALFYVVYRWLKPHLLGEPAVDHRPAWLLLGFAAQLVPWLFVTRAIFIYHYFGSLPFVMLCIAYAFEQMDGKRPKMAQVLQVVYMALVLVLFIGFYPIATGAEVPRVWGDAMNWLGFLKLPGWKYKGWLFY